MGGTDKPHCPGSIFQAVIKSGIIRPQHVTENSIDCILLQNVQCSLTAINVNTIQSLPVCLSVLQHECYLLTCTCRLMDWQADQLKSSISLQHRRSYAFLKLFTDPAFTTSAGRLFHTLTTLWLKKCFLVSNLDLSFASFFSCPLKP